MPEESLYFVAINAFSRFSGTESVPQIVEPEMSEPSPLQCLDPFPVQPSVVVAAFFALIRHRFTVRAGEQVGVIPVVWTFGESPTWSRQARGSRG